MIYLLDSEYADDSHSRYVLDVIKEHTDVHVELIPLSKQITTGELAKTVYSLFQKVTADDIVLCTWAVPGNYGLDELFTELSMYCNVVAAAGNFSKPIDEYTPARADGVITVGTLNKKGLVAALSNYGDSKEIVWIPGTNYSVEWKNASGTSVSAALYAAFLAEAIKNNDPSLLNTLIDKQKKLVFDELLNGTKQSS